MDTGSITDSRFNPPTRPRPGSGNPVLRWARELVDLLLHPADFFRRHVDHVAPAAIHAAAYSLGVAGVIDRLSVRALSSDVGGRASAWSLTAENWWFYWLLCLAGGAVSGAIYFVVGGWWYRKRLEWSGSVSPDIDKVRRVYLIAAQVYTVPLLLYTAWETLVYPTPRAAFNGDDLVALAILVFLFWSVFVSYRGATSVFVVREWPAKIWFLILPGSFYFLTVIGVMLVMLLGLAGTRPQVDSPLQLERPAVTLDYPANWAVSSDPEDNPDRRFSIEPSIDDAAVHVFVYDFPLNTFDAALETVNSLAENFTIGEMEAIGSWGRFEGKGYALGLTMDGVKYHGRTFSVTYRNVSFEVIEISEAGASERLEPGFALIRDSFAFEPARAR